MADGVVVADGEAEDFTAAADDCGAAGKVQLVKLAYSADGVATPVTADANGMEVQGAGVAGTPAGGVHSVQGVAGGTAMPVSLASAPLPTDAATQTTLAAVLAKLLAAPSTEAKQDAGNTSVASIDTKTPALGQALAAASVPVVLTAAQQSALTPPSISTLATHAKQDTAQTALDAIATSVGTLDNAVAGNELQVDVVAALPAGTNNIGDVDIASALPAGDNNIGNVDLASAIPAGTNNIGDVDVLTLPALPAGNNNIGDVDVASLPALPAGDNAVGRVKITDGTDVADVLDLTNSNPVAVAIVDGSGDQITSFGGGVQYTEGDADATITGTAVMWEDGSNVLRAASAAKPLPVEIIAGGGSGGTATADDADFTAGTTQGTIAQGVYESAPSSVTDGDVGAIGITQTRAVRTVVEGTAAVSNAGLTELAAAINASSQMDVNIAASGATVPISHAALTELAAAIDTEVQVDVVGALPAGTNAIGKLAANSGVDIGDVDVTSCALPTGASTLAEQQTQTTALQLLDDTVVVLGTATYTETTSKGIALGAVRRDADTTLAGTTNEFAPLQVDANGALKVEIFDGGGSHTVDNNGTFATQVDGAALTALQLIDNPVLVDDAAATAGTSSVMMAGMQAVAHGAPDSADAGDAVFAVANRNRVQWVIGGDPNVKSATYNRTDAGTDDNLMPAISAGTKYAITKITVTLDEACTVGVAVRIGFGTANVPALGSSAADAVDDILFYHPGLVPGACVTVGDGSAVLGVGADGAELRMTNEVPTGGTLGVTITYFPIAS